jgi:hypothetical protein
MPVYLDKSKHRTAYGSHPEVSVDTWPDPDRHAARPGDEIGSAILAYVLANSGHANFPASPWSDRHGDIHLPNLDEPQPETDPIPVWRLLEDAFLGPSLYLKGQQVPWSGWPIHAWTVEPVNTSAEKVLAYLEKYGTNRKLAGQPHQSGRLFFPNPALEGSPVSPVMRWAGASH